MLYCQVNHAVCLTSHSESPCQHSCNVVTLHAKRIFLVVSPFLDNFFSRILFRKFGHVIICSLHISVISALILTCSLLEAFWYCNLPAQAQCWSLLPTVRKFCCYITIKYCMSQLCSLCPVISLMVIHV